MPRQFKIARTIRRPTVVGLVPPTSRPNVQVFLYTLDGSRQPGYFRWCWHPVSGDFVVGTAYRHALMIPRSDDRPAESWLRGFVFSAERLVAVRTYFWPLDAYDDWSAAHAQLDRRVYTAFVALAGPSLPGFSFVGQVDNRWLVQNFGRYASSW